MIKLGIFAREPDIYRAALWKKLSLVDDLDIRVYYFPSPSNPVVKATSQSSPLFDGYKYKIIPSEGERAVNISLADPDDFFSEERLDVALISGCAYGFERQARKYSRKYQFKLIFRGEITDMEYLPWIRSIIRNCYLKWFYRGVSAFCTVGKDAERHLLRKGISEDVLFFSPNAVDDQQIERQKRIYKRDKIREELGIDAGEMVFLFSGDMVERNQPMMLANAVMELKDSAKMVIIFIGEGPLAEKVFRKLKPILGRRIMAPGACNFFQAGYYFSIADVFVEPTEYSPWGMEVNMAMHWEVPVIVSNRCGCSRDLVIDGYTGFSYYYQDGNSLVRYMRKFVTEQHLASKMGVAAYQEIQKYSLENSVVGLTEALRYVQKQAELDRVKFQSKDPFK